MKVGNWKQVAAGAVLIAGVGTGAFLATGGSANAATGAVTAATSAVTGAVDQSQSVRPDEHLLTGDDAAKVTAAALAQYPGATIERVETDSDGVYEAHIVTAAGDDLIVQVGSDFAVTGTQQGGGGHHGSGPDTDSDTDTTPGG